MREKRERERERERKRKKVISHELHKMSMKSNIWLEVQLIKNIFAN